MTTKTTLPDTLSRAALLSWCHDRIYSLLRMPRAWGRTPEVLWSMVREELTLHNLLTGRKGQGWDFWEPLGIIHNNSVRFPKTWAEAEEEKFMGILTDLIKQCGYEEGDRPKLDAAYSTHRESCKPCRSGFSPHITFCEEGERLFGLTPGAREWTGQMHGETE